MTRLAWWDKSIKPALIVFGLVSLLIALISNKVPYGLTVNISESLPRGLYLTQPFRGEELQRGQIACFSYKAPDWAKPRKYIPEGMDVCKPIGALNGDSVVTTDAAVIVKNKAGYLKEYPLLKTDSRGRAMPKANLQSDSIPPGVYVLLSDHNPRSFDARYLGLKSVSEITRTLKPIWTE